MTLRTIALALSASLLCAAAEPPPPPAGLEPYLENGRYKPGAFGWTKGRFLDATAEEVAAYRAIVDWQNACRGAAQAELREQLAVRGYPEAPVDTMGSGPLLCRQLSFQPLLADFSSFAAVEREMGSVGPVIDAFLAATRLAEESSRPSASADLGRQLEARPLGEQVLRRASTWGVGNDTDSPQLSPLGRALFQARIGIATVARDEANTEWLKGVVAERGWPTISAVGEEASFAAWLLVQHADADPAFQLDALRLMEPLVVSGEVSKSNYAYLYDRVMLKLAGKQRYATQVRCRDGIRAPQPLEDEANVDRLRSEVGLPPVSEYIEQFNKMVPCEGLPENTIRSQGEGRGEPGGGPAVS